MKQQDKDNIKIMCMYVKFRIQSLFSLVIKEYIGINQILKTSQYSSCYEFHNTLLQELI